MTNEINDKQSEKNLMNLAIYAGSLLISNGAESYRAEDTVERMVSSTHAPDNVDCYALPTAIFLSVIYKGENISIFKKIKVSDTNMKKIDMINAFSRSFVKNNYNLDEAYEYLKKIENYKESKGKEVLAGAIATSFFTALFGGKSSEFISSFFIGAIISYFIMNFSKFKLSFFINNVVSAALTSILAIISVYLGLGKDFDKIIIGVIMLIVPGLAITNALRDIMSGEFITGAITLVKAVFIALAIAIGVGIGLKLMRGIV